MKTTENISIAGYAFTIETDAYEVLSRYIDDIRMSFDGNPSADEITDDIEERIAELLLEKCGNGTVVNISMIEDIRRRIGNPEEFAGNESVTEDSRESHGKQSRNRWKNRKIYRNIDERVIGGVCSGLGTYFGIDKFFFRIIFLILAFIGLNDDGLFCIPVVAYICLWIAMPAARTVEQKCQMKGKPIDLSAFNAKDLDLKKEAREVAQSPAVRSLTRAGSLFIGIMLLAGGIAGLLGCIFIPSVPEIIERHIELDFNRYEYMPQGWDKIVAGLLCDTAFWGLVMVMITIGCIGLLYGGIMMAFDLKAPKWKPGLVIFIAWILSIFVVAAWIISYIADKLPSMIV